MVVVLDWLLLLFVVEVNMQQHHQRFCLGFTSMRDQLGMAGGGGRSKVSSLPHTPSQTPLPIPHLPEILYIGRPVIYSSIQHTPFFGCGLDTVRALAPHACEPQMSMTVLQGQPTICQ